MVWFPAEARDSALLQSVQITFRSHPAWQSLGNVASSLGCCTQGVKMTTHLHSGPRWRIHNSLSLPHAVNACTATTSLFPLPYIQPFKAYWLCDTPTSLTFKNRTLCPHCIYVFCIHLRRNSNLCHLQHKLIGFYSWEKKCLQRGMDWAFK